MLLEAEVRTCHLKAGTGCVCAPTMPGSHCCCQPLTICTQGPAWACWNTLFTPATTAPFPFITVIPTAICCLLPHTSPFPHSHPAAALCCPVSLCALTQVGWLHPCTNPVLSQIRVRPENVSKRGVLFSLQQGLQQAVVPLSWDNDLQDPWKHWGDAAGTAPIPQETEC